MAFYFAQLRKENLHANRTNTDFQKNNSLHKNRNTFLDDDHILLQMLNAHLDPNMMEQAQRKKDYLLIMFIKPIWNYL